MERVSGQGGWGEEAALGTQLPLRGGEGRGAVGRLKTLLPPWASHPLPLLQRHPTIGGGRGEGGKSTSSTSTHAVYTTTGSECVRVCYQLQNWPLPPSRSPTRVPWGVGADGWADGRLLPSPPPFTIRESTGGRGRSNNTFSGVYFLFLFRTDATGGRGIWGLIVIA